MYVGYTPKQPFRNELQNLSNSTKYLFDLCILFYLLVAMTYSYEYMYMYVHI